MPWWLLPLHKSYCMLTHICERERNQFWAFIFYALYKFNLLNFKSKLSARVILVVIVAGYKQGGSMSLIWPRSLVSKLLRLPVFYIHMHSHITCSVYVLPQTRSHAFTEVWKCMMPQLPTYLLGYIGKWDVSVISCQYSHQLSTQSASVTCHTVWLEYHFLSEDIWVIIEDIDRLSGSCLNQLCVKFSCHSSIFQIKTTATRKGQLQYCVIAVRIHF